MFQNELDVDETLAQLLVAEGFGALEEVAYVELDELAAIEGFDEELAAELQSRAHGSARAPRGSQPRASAARSASRTRWPKCPYLTEAMLVTLGKAGHQDARRSRRSRHRRADRRRSARSRAAATTPMRPTRAAPRTRAACSANMA